MPVRHLMESLLMWGLLMHVDRYSEHCISEKSDDKATVHAFFNLIIVCNLLYTTDLCLWVISHHDEQKFRLLLRATDHIGCDSLLYNSEYLEI
jgi:hypothetical protein